MGRNFRENGEVYKEMPRKIVGQAKLSYDELLTALSEVEMVLNSRPLTYVSTNDFEEPLTPSHLLIGRRVMSLPYAVPSDHRDDEVTASQLSRRSRHLNLTLDRFWSRWRSEYLLELREAHRHNKGTSWRRSCRSKRWPAKRLLETRTSGRHNHGQRWQDKRSCGSSCRQAGTADHATPSDTVALSP